MSEPHSPLTCPACRIIDAEDGTIDGHLGKHYADKVENENKILADLKSQQDRAADSITNFAGSMRFVYLHSAWFAVWIIINVGAFGAALIFDKFPFGLLTMIVSLEAIFLSTFVMISQNRQAARADVRSRLDFETNIRSEIWSVHIGKALGVDLEHVEGMVKDAINTAREET
jgi:uncharacterized membrane protein